MNLREILNEDIIDLEVEGTTKDEVLHNMATLLLNNGYINDVEQFRDHKLMVSADDQQPLDYGQYYYHQIIGLDVETTDGRHLGKIKEILSPGANDVWVVERPEKRDLLLPVIDDVVKNVDLDKNLVTVELMEGLE